MNYGMREGKSYRQPMVRGERSDVARSMHGAEVGQWRPDLEELQRPSLRNNLQGGVGGESIVKSGSRSRGDFQNFERDV